MAIVGALDLVAMSNVAKQGFGNIHADAERGKVGSESSANVVGCPIFWWDTACFGDAPVDGPLGFVQIPFAMFKYSFPAGSLLDATQDSYRPV